MEQKEQKPDDMHISQSFSLSDLEQSIKLCRNFNSAQVQEAVLQTEEERIEKYICLKDLHEFLKASQDPKALEILSNKNLLCEISKRVDKDQMPLEYSSDEEFMYVRRREELQDLDMFDQRIDENDFVLNNVDTFDAQISDEEVVNLMVQKVKEICDKEKGRAQAKKINLGDTIATKIETCVIVQQHFLTEKDLRDIDRNKTLIYGNVKAMIPLMRERLSLDFDENEKSRYKRGIRQPLKEKRIFGILTRSQVGHIPSVDICFTEDEENFIRDSYIFKSLVSQRRFENEKLQDQWYDGENVVFSQQEEMHKLIAINDYSKQAIANEMEDQFIQVGTLNQIETFHLYLMNDLYRQEKSIDFKKAFAQGREKDKKYYIIPLKMCDQSSFDADTVQYKVDRKLLEKVEKLSIEGYKGTQSHVIQELIEKQILGDDRIDYLNRHVLVKEDKPHRCYHFFQMFENLKQMKAEDFAVAIKGKPENLNATTAYDLLFTATTRFQSIMSFRDCLFQNQKDSEAIKNLPIMLLDPAKIISHRKFKYALDQCPKRPNKKQEYKKQYKEKHNLTTSQGKPIFSSFNIYRHYLSFEQWERASQLPLVLLFFERALYTHQLTQDLGTEIHPEFVLWATSNAGIQSSKKCYETLETYGDTILKLAATMLSYFYHEKNDQNADENKIDQLKIAFITNLYLLRIGKRLRLSRYMRTSDPDVKSWNPPFSEQVSASESLSCNGKHIADCVESLLGAHFMTNNLYKTLKLISDIRLVPLKQAKLLEYFPDRDLTFVLGQDIDEYQFDMSDNVEAIFTKYFKVQNVDLKVQQRLYGIIDKTKANPKVGEAFFELINSEQLKDLGQRELEKKLIEYLLPVEQILDYEFQNKHNLLEAFTHKSFKEYHGLSVQYEKLEMLGDAILDYLANSNLIKYTILEKYNLDERISQEYITQEDFQPFDAHQAKSLLTKNDFLAKLICLFGLQKYILYHQQKHLTIEEIKAQMISRDGIFEQWKLKKEVKKLMDGGDIDKFINYSFKRDFLINGREIELFEAPKMLGDVFESLIGAIFMDGGIEKVLQVYQHLLSPFILFTAKFSKRLYKEPKEQFNMLANSLKIKPDFREQIIEINSIEEFMENINDPEKLKSTYNVISKNAYNKEESIEEIMRLKMRKCDIMYNGNEIMTSGFGNSKKQSERNASIQGQKFLFDTKINKTTTNVSQNNNMMMEDF